MTGFAVPALHGSAVALPTPFKDGTIDQHALRLLAQRQIDAGTTALVVCGSTGEAASLSIREYGRAIETVVAAVQRRVPVVAGCTAQATTATAELALIAACKRADALLG